MRYGLVILSAILLITSACTQKHYAVATDDSVSLYYFDDKAREIIFASSADNFHHHKAVTVEEGLWRVTVPSGHDFKYFYIVDGVITLPECTYTEFDDFGTKNCVYVHGM